VSGPLAPGGDPPREVERLREKLGARWPAIEQARARAQATLDRLPGALADCLPAGTCFIAFGSLARREATRGSDVDWRLLVDAAAGPVHPSVVPEIRARLAALGLDDPHTPEPSSGVWLGRELAESVGRGDDGGTPPRVLLALKSTAIGDPEVHDRVVRSILRRYAERDLRGADDPAPAVPRLLLDDIVRYRRGLVAEFAQKRRRPGWAVRRAKLRMPRRLSCAAGVLTCLSCDYALDGAPGPDAAERRVDHLARMLRKAPLDVVAGTLLRFDALSAPARELMGAYDDFLRLMDTRREHLEALRPGQAAGDAVHREVRVIARRFERALTAIFTGGATPLPELTRRYGVL
jgi:hypothetical protein